MKCSINLRLFQHAAFNNIVTREKVLRRRNWVWTFTYSQLKWSILCITSLRSSWGLTGISRHRSDQDQVTTSETTFRITNVAYPPRLCRFVLFGIHIWEAHTARVITLQVLKLVSNNIIVHDTDYCDDDDDYYYYYYYCHHLWRLSFFSDFQVRLTGSSLSSAGTIEVSYYGVWGSITYIDIRVGHVICRQLGYSDAQKVSSGKMFGQLKGPVLIEQISCNGNESVISQCTIMVINERSRWYYFYPRYRAGVLCVESRVELSKGGYSRKSMT